jgi:hypothetical protein
MWRFLYDNLINLADMISVSSLRTGFVTAALKSGTGSAVITTGGNFSGSEDIEYIVEIDSIAAGAEVGLATFKWSDGGGSWNASGVTTDSSPVTLNNGVTVQWASGAGADFVVGDKWYLKGVNLFNAGKMIDWDRDSEYRSQDLEAPNTIIIDFGSAQEVTALVIFDHNFTSGVTLTLDADDAVTFDSDGGNPQFTEAVTYAADKILHYLSTATMKHYWRLSVIDAANPDGYISIGEIFLGTYFAPTENFDFGQASRGTKSLLDSVRNQYGAAKKRFYNRKKEFSYRFSIISETDMDGFETMLAAIADRDTGIINPLYFNEDSSETGDFWMVELESLPRELSLNSRYSTLMEMTEAVRSV